jgi:RNA-directed DNA polymerase
VDEAKPFDIPKREVWEAFKKVKANQGAAGVDGQSIADFEADLSNNLYKRKGCVVQPRPRVN